MLYFKLKKFEGDDYFYCYQIKPNGEVKNRAYRYPVRQTKNGMFQYRKDWFFGFIKGTKWSKERSAIDTMHSMKELRDWEVMAVIAIFAGVVSLAGFLINSGGK